LYSAYPNWFLFITLSAPSKVAKKQRTKYGKVQRDWSGPCHRLRLTIALPSNRLLN